MRIERRLHESRWLIVVVPVASIAVAFGLMAIVLLATGHAPGHTYRRLIDSAFFASGSMTTTFISATPLAFTGLAAAVAFRMQLFNIGGEGQLYFGAIGAAAGALVVASPTRGLDVAAIETVHRYLRDAASSGVGVLLISEDLDEILALADRVAVIYEGAIVGEVDAGASTVEEIGLLMAGGEG
jgi:hypothetical protein